MREVFLRPGSLPSTPQPSLNTPASPQHASLPSRPRVKQHLDAYTPRLLTKTAASSGTGSDAGREAVSEAPGTYPGRRPRPRCPENGAADPGDGRGAGARRPSRMVSTFSCSLRNRMTGGSGRGVHAVSGVGPRLRSADATVHAPDGLGDGQGR